MKGFQLPFPTSVHANNILDPAAAQSAMSPAHPTKAQRTDPSCAPTMQVRMNPRELRVLLHEMGHCLHSLCSRTRYQHLWGTRCAQDVVEVGGGRRHALGRQ